MAPDPSRRQIDWPKRRKVDWEAVERDYRTGKFTETELATKYGATRSAVNKQARTKGWQKDLRDEIKQATNARLVADLVAKEVAEGGKKVAETVLAAAEVNVQVILGHRSDIKAARDLAADLMQELRFILAGLGSSYPRGPFEEVVVVLRGRGGSKDPL